MTVTRVQANGQSTGTSANGVCPAWGSTTVAGNLLVLIAQGNSNSPVTAPSGYTMLPGFAFGFDGANGRVSIAVKIAAGADATPGNFTSTGGFSPGWMIYSYEFAATLGWHAEPIGPVRGTGSGAAVTTLGSGATLRINHPNPLAIAIAAMDATGASALAFTSLPFTLDLPATNDSRLWVGWAELSGQAASVATTATWTSSVPAGVVIATFQAVEAPVALPGQDFQYGGFATA